MATELQARRLAAGMRLTLTEWSELEHKAPFDLVNGRLTRIPDVASWHDFLLFNLAMCLVPFVKQHRLGQFGGPTTRMRISDVSGRQPDMFFVPVSLYHLVGPNLFTGVPPLVIELLSIFNVDLDRITKYEEYARLGILEYWIVDFPNRCLEVHRLVESPDGSRSYHLAEAHRGDAIFRPTLFPGLDIPLADIWPTEFEHPAAP